MRTLVENFPDFLRHERGQSEHTQKTYAALLGGFVIWAENHKLTDWKSVELSHLTSFLLSERERPVKNQPEGGVRKLSSETVYLQIAALRAFYRFAENEKLLPANVAETLSLPRRWQRLPKSLSAQEMDKLLTPETPETPEHLCDQAVLELAYVFSACASRNCATPGSNNCTSTPGSSTWWARATRNGSCRSGARPSPPSTAISKPAGPNSSPRGRLRTCS